MFLCIVQRAEPPLARPLVAPRAMPLALGKPLPLVPPLPARPAGAGVENLLDGFELVGGFSTKLVSVVLLLTTSVTSLQTAHSLFTHKNVASTSSLPPPSPVAVPPPLPGIPRAKAPLSLLIKLSFTGPSTKSTQKAFIFNP